MASDRQAARKPNSRGTLTRANLLSAAAEAFAERGFHGTSTRDIAEAARMSAAALYAHFATKEEILFELSLDGHRSVHQVLLTSLEPCRNAREGLLAASTAFAQWHAQFHTQARVVQYELKALTPTHLEQVMEWRRSTRDLFAGLVREGVSDEWFSVGSIEQTTMILTSMGIDVARWYSPSGPLTPAEIGAFYGETALRVVGCRR